jgi:hypothetical protein
MNNAAASIPGDTIIVPASIRQPTLQCKRPCPANRSRTCRATDQCGSCRKPINPAHLSLHRNEAYREQRWPVCRKVSRPSRTAEEYEIVCHTFIGLLNFLSRTSKTTQAAARDAKHNLLFTGVNSYDRRRDH